MIYVYLPFNIGYMEKDRIIWIALNLLFTSVAPCLNTLQWFSPCLAVKLFTEKAEVWGKGVGALCEAKDFNSDSVLALAFVFVQS